MPHISAAADDTTPVECAYRARGGPPRDALAFGRRSSSAFERRVRYRPADDRTTLRTRPTALTGEETSSATCSTSALSRQIPARPGTLDRSDRPLVHRRDVGMLHARLERRPLAAAEHGRRWCRVRSRPRRTGEGPLRPPTARRRASRAKGEPCVLGPGVRTRHTRVREPRTPLPIRSVRADHRAPRATLLRRNATKSQRPHLHPTTPPSIAGRRPQLPLVAATHRSATADHDHACVPPPFRNGSHLPTRRAARTVAPSLVLAGAGRRVDALPHRRLRERRRVR